jgi:phage terminase Nu1 subunit (DNA packaging protein)
MANRKLITRRELAQRLGVVMQTVTKWEQAGMPTAEPGRKGKPSLYSVTDVTQWLKDREKAARKNGTLDVAQERARKEKAQAILAEQTVAIRAKELLPLEQVAKEWAKEVSAVRAKLLSWPTTISDSIYREATLNGLEGVERVIRASVEELLLELSKPKRVTVPRAAKKTARKVRRRKK